MRPPPSPAMFPADQLCVSAVLPAALAAATPTCNTPPITSTSTSRSYRPASCASRACIWHALAGTHAHVRHAVDAFGVGGTRDTTAFGRARHALQTPSAHRSAGALQVARGVVSGSTCTTVPWRHRSGTVAGKSTCVAAHRYWHVSLTCYRPRQVAMVRLCARISVAPPDGPAAPPPAPRPC